MSYHFLMTLDEARERGMIPKGISDTELRILGEE